MHLKSRFVFYGYGDFSALAEHLEYLRFVRVRHLNGELSYYRGSIVVRLKLQSEEARNLGDFFQITIESQDPTFSDPRGVYQAVTSFAVELSSFLFNTPTKRTK